MSHHSDLIESDIIAYLKQHENKELLRFLTCGSVDDGKSTLIGRLLHDSHMIFEDQLASIENDSKKVGTQGEKIDLALLVDGLQAEREQGITIDVAYRYFSTDKRKFIIADTPGHEQYTRNMATGASTCDLAVILIDARYGVQTQTRRHSFIASLLGIKHIVVAVNKMDLVEYSQDTFETIRNDYLDFAEPLAVNGAMGDIRFVPMSALDGDNVVNPSENMPWYSADNGGGQTLMQILESVQISGDQDFKDFRFPVQYVNRPNLDFRGFSGTVAAGEIRPGDEVMALPSGKSSRVKEIVTFDGNLDKAFIGQAVTITLEDEIDVSRGDMLVRADSQPEQAQDLSAMVVWMADQPLQPGRQYDIKLGAFNVSGQVSSITHRVDVNSMEKQDAAQLSLNEIGRCDFTLARPVSFDAYYQNRATGSFIIVDRLTNATVGAGMVQGKADSVNTGAVTTQERQARLGQQAKVVELAGASEEQLQQLARQLFDRGFFPVVSSNADVSDLLALGVVVLTDKAETVEGVERLDSQQADLVDAVAALITVI